MAAKKKHAGHGVKRVHVAHHGDGSHTVTMHGEDGSSRSSARADLPGVHDSLQENLNAPMQAEAPPTPAAPAAAMSAQAPMPGPVGV